MAMLRIRFPVQCRAPLKPVRLSRGFTSVTALSSLPPSQSNPAAPLPIKPDRLFPFPSCPSSTSTSPSLATVVSSIQSLQDAYEHASHRSRPAPGYLAPMMDLNPTPLYSQSMSDSEHMLFGPLDLDERRRPDSFSWDDGQSPSGSFASRPFPSMNQADFSPPTLEHRDSFGAESHAEYDESNYYFSRWIDDSEMLPSEPSTAPIPIPVPPSDSSSSQSFSPYSPYSDNLYYMKDDPYASSTDFATISFPSSGQSERRFHSSDGVYEEPFKSMSPPDPSMTPSWASQLFHSPASTAPIPLPLSPVEPADDLNATLRLPSPFRRPTTSLSQMFISASAPSAVETRPPPMSRGYSRRADSFSDNTDHDASTVRRKRRSLGQDDARTVVRGGENGPLKSALRPPKLAPSAWQLYFTDWISRHQATSSKKLNVAQAAKEAGQEYANLTAAEKEPYKRRSQELKEIREREYDHYIRSLTPDDIKRENVFRTAQRKAGKSRKGNIKDPNAPKKPLSAYFMFLQRIRSDKELVREVFGDETETTKQSVLAAHKWRSMTDEERQPFLAQAEQEKMEYEAARRLYEEGTIGFETSINFRLSPGSPILSASIPRSKQIMFPTKAEVSASSESEGEDF